MTTTGAILALGIVTATIVLLSLRARHPESQGRACVNKRLEHGGRGYNGHKEAIINAFKAGRQAFREAIEYKRR